MILEKICCTQERKKYGSLHKNKKVIHSITLELFCSHVRNYLLVVDPGVGDASARVKNLMLPSLSRTHHTRCLSREREKRCRISWRVFVTDKYKRDVCLFYIFLEDRKKQKPRHLMKDIEAVWCASSARDQTWAGLACLRRSSYSLAEHSNRPFSGLAGS